MDVEFIQLWFTASSVTPQYIWALPYPNFPKFGPHLHMYNRVKVHPYAHPRHMKVLNHFQYIPIWMWDAARNGLQPHHDTITSFGLHLTPIFQNLPPTCTGRTV